MRPQTGFLWSIVLALLVPALIPSAGAAAFYLPPECREVPPDVPEGCPGIAMGDPLAAPDGECIDPTTSFVYHCADTSRVIGVGVPAAYTYARARSAMLDSDCSAQTVNTKDVWCVQFAVAMVAFEGPDNALPGGDTTTRLRVDAWVDDNCNRLNPTVFHWWDDFDGPAVWNFATTGTSKCGHPFGIITATVMITDLFTGHVLHTSTSQAMYGPPGVYWVGVGSHCNPWQTVAPDTACKLYYNSPHN